MLEQLAIDGGSRAITSRGQTLSPKQQTALDFIRNTPGGVSADELGAHFHSQRTDRWGHSTDTRCINCARDGLSLLRSKGLKSLVVRRRSTSLWEPRERQPARPLEPLPDGEWEDLFV